MKAWKSSLRRNRSAPFVRLACFAPLREIVLLVLLLACLLCAEPVSARPQQTAPSSSAQQAPPAASALQQYPDSAAGLKRMLADLVALKNAGKDSALDARLAALVLPEYRTWFERHFGESRGAEFAEAYSRNLDRLPQILRSILEKSERLAANSEPAASRLFFVNVGADNEAKLFLIRAIEPFPIYELRSGKPSAAYGCFAFESGRFRFLWEKPVARTGDFGAVAGNANDEVPRRIRIAADGPRPVSQQEDIPPVFPPPTHNSRVQGTVMFEMLVGIDGRIRELRVVSGRPELVPVAANQLVRWRFEPAQLNGRPVEIVRTLEVVFSFSR